MNFMIKKYRFNMFKIFILLLVSLSFTQTFTLSRTSLVNDKSYHVATFDTKENAYYNCANCVIARNLFQNQSGVIVFYWCEPGRYKELYISQYGFINKVPVYRPEPKNFENRTVITEEPECDCYK